VSQVEIGLISITDIQVSTMWVIFQGKSATAIIITR